MTQQTQARVQTRALLAAVPVGLMAGAAVGLALGGAYLAGDYARTADSTAAEAAFSATTVSLMARQDPGLLAIALRYDPTFLAGYEPDQVALAEDTARVALRPSLDGRRGPAARPYRAALTDYGDERECLTEAVYYEARGETPAGQAAVAQVVLNRARHPAYPKSICGVVYQGAQRGTGCQFSFACNGAMDRNRETGAWRRAQTVAMRALNGYVMPEVGNATHFHVTTVNPAWGPALMRVNQVGAHIFYRFTGKRGRPASFSDEQKPEAPLIDAAPILASMTIVPLPAAPSAAMAAEQSPAGVVKVEAAQAAKPATLAVPPVVQIPAPAAKPEPVAAPAAKDPVA